MTTRLVTELAVSAGNNPGVLTKVLRALSRRGVKILAYRRCFEHGCYIIRLVTEVVLKAITALEEAGFTCTATVVVVVSSGYRSSTVAALSNLLRQVGIGIQYAYVSVSKDPEQFAIFKTADDQRALGVLAATDLDHTAQR